MSGKALAAGIAANPGDQATGGCAIPLTYFSNDAKHRIQPVCLPKDPCMSIEPACDDYLHEIPSDRTSQTDDERIAEIVPLPPPAHLIRFFPIQGTPIEALISRTRDRVKQILRGQSDRLLVVIGPCSIHNPAAAIEYASRLADIRQRLDDDLEIIMRVYFEKPRTTVGWKGLINDPYLDGTFRINEGLRIARDLLLRIHQLGVPAGSEFLDTISPQYLGDLISWGAIGARTTESQVHRELASGLSARSASRTAPTGTSKSRWTRSSPPRTSTISCPSTRTARWPSSGRAGITIAI